MLHRPDNSFVIEKNGMLYQVIDGMPEYEALNNQYQQNPADFQEDSNTIVEVPLTYAEKRAAEYPAISDQLDMIYWDKVNGTNNWQSAISTVKAKYPKNESDTNSNDFVSNV